MPIGALAGILFGLTALSLGFYHVTFAGPRIRALEQTLSGEQDSSEAESIARLRATQVAFTKRTEDRLDELERVARREVHRVGFIRYNSFSDVGSDLSFTLALLNDDGNGVVVTSIYSREETRTYGKAVKQFVPQQGASKEEQSAIAMARNGSAG